MQKHAGFSFVFRTLQDLVLQGRDRDNLTMHAKQYDAVLELPPCRFGMIETADVITGLTFLPPDYPLQPPISALAQRLTGQLTTYLHDPTIGFDLPIQASGTPFQKRVWAEISTIPSGQAREYRDLAAALHSAPRAIGQACGANPLPIVIPCHRVVAANGLGGFANNTIGWLIQTKRWLLWHEGLLI